MAFLMLSFVIICLAVIPLFTISTTALPAINELLSRSPYTAGIRALPGRLIPRASERHPIVFAVPKKAHEPQPGHAVFSKEQYSSFVILPTLYIPFASSVDVKSAFLPSNSIPPSIGPPITTMAGISSLAAAIRTPGTILSHEASNTTASSLCA